MGRGSQRPDLTGKSATFPHVKVNFTSFGQPKSSKEASDDAFAIRQENGCLIAALADGVGGARDGRAAAEKTVRLLTEHYLARPKAWTPARALREFTIQISRQLFQESQQRHEGAEMLSTLAAVALENGTLNGLNIGDSPVFVYRGSRLQRLTVEHVQEGRGMNHVLTRAMGMELEVEPHEFAWTPEPGDVILLCSDGVSKVIDDETLASLISRRASARGIVNHASEVARETEKDDLSAVVIEVVSPTDGGFAPMTSVEVIESPKPGTVVEGLRFVRSLREDRVWLAEDDKGGNHIFKIPPPDARVDEGIAAAFVREAWNASRFGHTEFFPAARIPESTICRGYIQEYIDAPTLRKVMKQRRLKVEEAVALGCFLLKAQSFLLSNDLAHGDVKPGNILMKADTDETPHFTLLDLGSAVEVFSTPGRAGTATFLAPERFGGAPVTERTELFSIGVTLYEALCGMPPYGQIERFQTPRFALPKRPSQLNPVVPPWLESVLLRAISVNPIERQQNYSEMLFELEHPATVRAFHRKGAPLLERNPVAFFRNALWVSVAVNIFLLARCHAS